MSEASWSLSPDRVACPDRMVSLADLAEDPHPIHARLRDAEPVSWVPALDGWLVTRADLVRQVLADPSVFTVDDPRFSTAQVVGPSMLSLDGPQHRRHRRPFVAGFHRAAARTAQRRLVDELAHRLIAGVRARGHAEVRTEIAGPVATGVMAAVLGLPEADADRLARWYRAIVDSVSSISSGHGPTGAGAAAFDDLARAVLAAAADDGGGTAAVLGPVRRQGTLSSEEVVSNAAVVMFGGIETTEATTATSALHLLSHPRWLGAVRDRPELVDRAVAESLRLEPAAARVDRYATVDTELAGQPIARGDLVIASLAAANRDPAVWPDPDTYDLDRYDLDRDNQDRRQVGDHLAFAHGPHACLAADLARWQAATVLRRLIELPGVHLEPGGFDAPRGLVFRKPDRVRVRWGLVCDADREEVGRWMPPNGGSRC